MGHACTPGDFHSPPAPNGEHPVVAVLAIVAIVLAILLIMWARVAVHGTSDIEEALHEATPATTSAPAAASKQPAKPAPQQPARPTPQQEVDEAVANSRFATGFFH